MTKSNFKKISIISIITFVGIFMMQAFWILDSYKERKAYFSEHVNFILAQAAQDYCKQLDRQAEISTNATSYQIMDSLLQYYFMQIEKLPAYTFYIVSPNDKNAIMEQANTMTYKQLIDCNKSSKKTLILSIRDDKNYFFGSIFGWVILSSLLIIIGIIALYLNISFLNQQKKTSRIKSDFISNMTHELKTPIATISVASEMLMKDKVLDDRKKTKRYSNIIFEENLRLKKLVDRVMQIALFENGTMQIRLKEADLHHLITHSTDALKMLINQRKGSLTIELKATKSNYTVDPTHFSNIISNLLENAIKYSSKPPIIHISTADYSEGILISIADQGIGIAKKHRERIFDRFYRVESGDVQNTQGFGLGLYYVRRVVEAHGGFIKVYSEESKGSRFEIYIPLLKV